MRKSPFFAALIRLSTTTHNLLAFNISEISSKNSEKLSLLANKHLWTFLLHSSYASSRMWSHAPGRDHISLVSPALKVHLQVCFYLIHLTPKSLFPKLSGHLWIVNNIVPFCLSPDHAHVSVHSCQMKREYNTILDDADSTNRSKFILSQSFTWCSPGNFPLGDQCLKVNCLTASKAALDAHWFEITVTSSSSSSFYY